MDKNFFIALAVSLVLYMGYSHFVPQDKASVTPTTAVTQTQDTVASSTVTAAKQAATPIAAPAKEEKETLYTIEIPTADITLTSKGAAIKDYIFKDVIKPVNLTPYAGDGYFATLPSINFTKVESAEGDIAFKAQVAEGLSLVKTYDFSRDNGIGKISLKFVNSSKTDLDVSNLFVNLGPGLNTVKSEESENPANWRAICMIKEEGKKKPSVNQIRTKEMDNPSKLEEACRNWIWSGIENRYFLVAFIPQDWTTAANQLKFSEHFVYNKDSFFGLFGQKAVKGPQLDISLPKIVPANGELNLDADFFIGPKDYNNLLKLPYNLERSIQFGFFGQFGKWARNLLEWLYGITHNYGWAIVLMTVLIQICLFPLTYKQLKSAAVMQKIQPEMKRLQEKYKGDPATQQRELMALYKKYGANPLSGCLPLFIQLPIFLALFNALRTSWALHGAPFIWWITDLSAKDPYYVLPIAMGIIMFVQQKMTMPATMEDNPSMAMMKWMPVFMTVIFLNFPAGLTLYWFVSNCISFVINLVLKRKLAAAK